MMTEAETNVVASVPFVAVDRHLAGGGALYFNLYYYSIYLLHVWHCSSYSYLLLRLYLVSYVILSCNDG